MRKKKSYFVKGIFSQIKGSLKEVLIVFSIVLISSSLLSMSLFIRNSSNLEKALLDSVPLSIQVYNDNIFSNTNLNTVGKRLEPLLNEMEKLVSSENVSTSNLNIISEYGFGDVRIDDYGSQYLYSYDVIGVNSSQFETVELLNIIEGRMISDYEIENNLKKAVVSSKMTINDNGEIRNVRVGDIVNLYSYSSTGSPGMADHSTIPHTAAIINCKIIASYEIVGVYQDNLRYQLSEINEDLFDNSNFVIVPYQSLKELILNNNSTYAGQPFSLNRFTVYAKDTESYLELEKEYDKFIENASEKIKKEMKLASYFLEFNVKDNGYQTALESIKNIKWFYNLVFIILFSLTAITLAFILFNILKDKRNEIVILSSLGEGKVRMIARYSIFYCSVGIFAIAAGFFGGYYISYLLKKVIMSNFTDMQYQLLSYANNGMAPAKVSEMVLSPTPLNEILTNMGLEYLIIELIIFLVIIISILIIFRNFRKRRVA